MKKELTEIIQIDHIILKKKLQGLVFFWDSVMTEYQDWLQWHRNHHIFPLQ